ncbi:hypothetical protein T02_13065 [Trichinella nativa]|uniref:Uncharacterized protein n=1 Tax=Trichinella nativa TaxID=6335 RepID=A0A0V1KIW9_9BILA|nr:hypothetical protein T02_13065 [Trichinella nativa]
MKMNKTFSVILSSVQTERRESWARHQAEEKQNVFRFTG